MNNDKDYSRYKVQQINTITNTQKGKLKLICDNCKDFDIDIILDGLEKVCILKSPGVEIKIISNNLDENSKWVIDAQVLEIESNKEYKSQIVLQKKDGVSIFVIE